MLIQQHQVQMLRLIVHYDTGGPGPGGFGGPGGPGGPPPGP